MKRFIPFALLWIVLLSGPAANSVSAATTNSWTWGGSGFWHHATNWLLLSNGTLPAIRAASGTNTTYIQITAAGLNKTIIVDSNSALANLTINSLRVVSASSQSNWLVLSNLNSYSPFTVRAGATFAGPGSRHARLIVTNSTLIVDGSTGGELNTSNGTINVQGESTVLLTNGSNAKIGNGASGILTLASNSWLRVVESNFVVGVGASGVGNVTVQGGTLEVGHTFTIGDDTGSTGHVVVASGLLRADYTNANAEIGQNGGGQLTLSNGVCQFDDVSVGRHDGARGTFRIFGGTCFGSDISVGRFSNSFGILTMGGGQLVLSGNLYAGREGRGTIIISNSSSVQALDLIVAHTNGSTGTATFLGGTSLFSAAIFVGSSQSTGSVVVAGGSLICTNSANTSVVDVVNGSLTVSNGSAAFDTVLLTNAGQLRLFGGTTLVDQITVTNGGPFVIGNGSNAVTVQLTGGGSTFYNGLVISSNVTVLGAGAINGPVTNYGTVTADGGPLVFTGTFVNGGTTNTVNGGTLRFGSGPTNSLLTLQRVPTGVRLFFGTTNGAYYTPVYKTAFTDPLWLPLPTVPGNNSVMGVGDGDLGHPQRIYRVRVQ